jgi:hypothetical protein
MNYGLEGLVDGDRIAAIDVGVVPYPPHARNPGDHLFANCHYSVAMADTPLADLFHTARSDAINILGRLASTSATQIHVGLVVCVYGHFAVPGAERPVRRRIYDICVLCRDLIHRDGPLTIDNLAELHAIEDSQLTDVAELRHKIKSACKN